MEAALMDRDVDEALEAALAAAICLSSRCAFS